MTKAQGRFRKVAKVFSAVGFGALATFGILLMRDACVGNMLKHRLQSGDLEETATWVDKHGLRDDMISLAFDRHNDRGQGAIPSVLMEYGDQESVDAIYAIAEFCRRSMDGTPSQYCLIDAMEVLSQMGGRRARRFLHEVACDPLETYRNRRLALAYLRRCAQISDVARLLPLFCEERALRSDIHRLIDSVAAGAFIE